MMNVQVKLYGTLRFPGYQPSQGIEVEIPDGTTVKDLLALLEISESQRAVVIVEGRILKADDEIRPGVPVSVLQAIHGG
jgi:molybdopterin synthase sulfur carrier subunit